MHLYSLKLEQTQSLHRLSEVDLLGWHEFISRVGMNSFKGLALIHSKGWPEFIQRVGLNFQLKGWPEFSAEGLFLI